MSICAAIAAQGQDLFERMIFMAKRRDVYPSVEANGRKGAERIAAMYSPGGEYYRPGNKVHIEHGEIPCWGSNIPGSDSYGKSEPGYRVIVENDN